MSWSEFSSLLAGIMPDTPLGKIVEIRSEEDKEMLKSFTQEQHRIRNEWRARQINSLTDDEKETQIKEVQELFAKAFGEALGNN